MIARHYALRLCGVMLLLLHGTKLAKSEKLRNIAADAQILRRMNLLKMNKTLLNLNVHSNHSETAYKTVKHSRRHSTDHVVRRKRNHYNADAHNGDAPPMCSSRCQLEASQLRHIQQSILSILDENVALVTFKIHFLDTNRSLLEVLPYMGDTYRASEWLWVRGKIGRQLLVLPLDADVLSLHLLSLNQRHVQLDVISSPSQCFVKLSPTCRLQLVQQVLTYHVTSLHHKRDQEDSLLCHRVLQPSSASARAIHLRYKCCDVQSHANSQDTCSILSNQSDVISSTVLFLDILAVFVTLYSPLMILYVKLLLSYDASTKFFRASLKHGITGQRNYVIRISSRQLVDLNDKKPYSLPRFAVRLLLHCYGEGRCLIHCWGDWSAQPAACTKRSSCQRAYMFCCRLVAVLVVCPCFFYAAFMLYAIHPVVYRTVLELRDRFEPPTHVDLDLNVITALLFPVQHFWMFLWMAFSFICFLYAVFIISWPSSSLEDCLVGFKGKRGSQSKILYRSLSQGYKNVLQRLAYGEYPTKRHLLRVSCLPHGLRRCVLFVGRLLMFIPAVNVTFSLARFDRKLYRLFDRQRDVDEVDAGRCASPQCASCVKWVVTIVMWAGFVFIFAGYCSAIYLVTQFAFNVIFFTFLGVLLQANVFIPWLCFVAVVFFYLNDCLTTVNKEHAEILKLIDENSPRISAVDDTESLLREESAHILNAHNLGAVKFINGDKTEYVSKELYYGVCDDLKCGWSHTIRRVLLDTCACALYAFVIFVCLWNISAFYGPNLVRTLLALVVSLLPKLLSSKARTDHDEKVAIWTRIMPDVLDRHIRVDRSKCLDEAETALSTYDVRPVGILELDVPKMVIYNNLRMWKFPWIVSADQQVRHPEAFVAALASKLAAATLLSKIVTRLYQSDLSDERVLRQWCLLVENSIQHASATANNINGAPLESVRLFPPESQSLVSHFRTGSTIDNVVDNINRELYGPYTKGVLVTISNTPVAISKLDNMLFAFNAGCHGEQVTDLFGAILIMATFNTQNLQTIVKFIMDPYSPDTVPVYSIIPMEGFIFQSPEILELETPSPR